LSNVISFALIILGLLSHNSTYRKLYVTHLVQMI